MEITYINIFLPFSYELTCWNVLKVEWKELRTSEDIAIDHNATRFIKNPISSKYYNCKPSEMSIKERLLSNFF
jgi:hypothetical protein